MPHVAHARKPKTGLLAVVVLLCALVTPIATATPARALSLPSTGVAPATRAAARLSAGQEAWLDIPSLGLHQAIYRGGQATIDQGVVTHYAAPGIPTRAAGEAGVYWLAAHNYAAFASLPSIRTGATVTVTSAGGDVVTYRITRRRVTATYVDSSVVFSGSGARLLLQTCVGSMRLLVFGQREE